MHSHLVSFLAVSATLPSFIAGQAPPAKSQLTSFNSTFSLSPSQIESASLSDDSITNIENIVNFDRSQLTHGGPRQDDFYNLPPLTNDTQGPLKAGQLLKVQRVTDPTVYAIPPSTALSRILYTSQNLNGTVIPTSAYILWPFSPRRFSNDDVDGESAAPVVLWTHASSGIFADLAPSSHRGLWHANAAPFTLAQAGYAVVAPDYAGLGVDASWDGSFIHHEYLSSPVAAGNALDALRASRQAFPAELRDEFVAMGHSQGGGVAWGVAEALAATTSGNGSSSCGGRFAELVDGYRGTVAISPTTRAFTGLAGFIAPWVGQMLHRVFPDFELEQWLTPLGIARVELFRELQGGISLSQHLFLTGEDLVHPDYDTKTWHAAAYANLSDVGARPFKGPLIVIQGTDDLYVSYNVTKATVEATWDFISSSHQEQTDTTTEGLDLEFLVVPGVGHGPAMEATRMHWLQWIEDRFEGRDVPASGAVRTEWESFLEIERYQAVGNAFPQWVGLPEYGYQAPLGL